MTSAGDNTHAPRFAAALAFALALTLSTAAPARSPRTSPRQQDAATPAKESQESSVTKESDVAKAEESCARAEALSKQGDTRGALKASGESVKLYKKIYLDARQPSPASAPDAPARFRAEMAARLSRAPACMELYSRLGGPKGENDFKRGQFEALRAHAAGIAESDASSVIYFGPETDERAAITYKPEPRYPRDERGKVAHVTVRLRVVLSADGEAKHPLVLSGSDSDFFESSVEAAKGTKFKPAARGGRAVSQFATLEYTFTTF